MAEQRKQGLAMLQRNLETWVVEWDAENQFWVEVREASRQDQCVLASITELNPKPVLESAHGRTGQLDRLQRRETE